MIGGFLVGLVIVAVLVLAQMVRDERKPTAREEAQKKHFGCSGGSFPGCPHANGCQTPISCSADRRCLDCA